MRSTLAAFAAFALAACGGGSDLTFQSVVSIPASDGSGSELSGTFGGQLTVESNGCTEKSLETPAVGDTEAFDIEVTQADGALTMGSIYVKLSGGVTFKGAFEAGGADIVDRNGQIGNIERLVRVTGEFKDADNFDARGETRLTGQIDFEPTDCSFTFRLTGIRKNTP
jgi:hypothetical protein